MPSKLSGCCFFFFFLFFFFSPPPPPPPPPLLGAVVDETGATGVADTALPPPAPPPTPPPMGALGVSGGGGACATTVGLGAAMIPPRSGLIAVPTTTPKPRASAANMLTVCSGIGKANAERLVAAGGSIASAGRAYGSAIGGPTRWPHSMQYR